MARPGSGSLLSGTERTRTKQVCFSCLHIDFSERVINSRADFRQHYTNREVGTEIGPCPSRLSARGIKRSICDGECPAATVLCTLPKAAACLRGWERELWSRHPFGRHVSSSLDVQSQKHTDLPGRLLTRSGGYFISGHSFLTAEESDL